MKAIIFDVDGVLIKDKDEFGNYLWSKNISSDLGISSDHERQLFSSDWSLVIKGLIDTQQHFKNMFTKLNIDLPVDTLIDYWLTHDTTVNTDIFPILTSIKGPKLYIGTNQDRYRTAVLQEKFGLYFDGIFSSYHIGAMKPEAAFFEHIESKLNMQAKDIAFIDDLKSNVEAAAQRGWTAHHYQNINELRRFIQLELNIATFDHF